MTPEIAQTLIEEERAAYPRVIDLARHLSLAVRIETELLRAMRLRALSGVEAGVEADLYFSPLVQTRDVNAITLVAEVRELLHQELAQHKDELELAREVIESAHGPLDAAILLEERVAYHALRDDQQAYADMQRQLGQLILELEPKEVDPGLLGWAADAYARLPERARNSQAGRQLSGLLSGHLDSLGVELPAVQARRGAAGSRLATMRLGFRAGGDAVELCFPHRAGWTEVEILAADPLSLELAWPVPEGWEGRAVELSEAEPLRRISAVPPGLLRLRGINGDETRLRVEGPFKSLKPKLLGLFRGLRSELPAFYEQELEDLAWALSWRPLRSQERPQVFLSMPERGRLASLYEALKAQLERIGFSVWSTDEGVSPGDDWNREISRVLAECQSAVVVLSPETSPQSGWLKSELSQLAFRQEVDDDFTLHFLLGGGLEPEGAASLLAGLAISDALRNQVLHESPESLVEVIAHEQAALNPDDGEFAAAILHFPDSSALTDYANDLANRRATLGEPLESLVLDARPVLLYAGGRYQGRLHQGIMKYSGEVPNPELQQAFMQLSELGIEQQLMPSNREEGDRHQLLRSTLLDAERDAIAAWLRRQREATAETTPPEEEDASYWMIPGDGEEGHRGTVRSIAISGDGAVALTAGNSHPDQTVKQWDLTGRRLVRSYEAFAEAGGWTPLAISSDGRRAAAGYGGELRLIDLQSGEPASLMLGEAPVTALAFIDETRVLVGLADGMLLRVGPSGVEEAIPIAREEVLRLEVRGSRAACLRRGAIELIDLRKGAPLLRIEIEQAEMEPHWQRPPLRYDENRNRIFFGVPLRVLDLRTGQVMGDPSQAVVELAGRRRVRSGGDASFTLLDDPEGEPFMGISIDPEQPACLALAGDGRRLVIADYEHNLHVYELPPVQADETGAAETGGSEGEGGATGSVETDPDLLRKAEKSAERWASEGYPPERLWEGERIETLRRLLESSEREFPPQLQDFAWPGERLVERLAEAGLDARERSAIGDRLDELGDPRPGIGLDPDGLPEIDWVEIPAGEFLFGEAGQAQRIHLERYYISRYPITNAQYQAFIDQQGYDRREWWEGLKVTHYQESEWRGGNRPKTNLNWYEATAFCRWLSRNTGVDIRMPNEHEWEKAARGTDGREYPWGDGYRSGLANLNEQETRAGRNYLRQACAVGLFPLGGSPYGVQDMAGNVWDWCQDFYYGSELNDYGEHGNEHVWRGGSWSSEPRGARAVVRALYVAEHRNNSIGFRVVCTDPVGLSMAS